MKAGERWFTVPALIEMKAGMSGLSINDQHRGEKR